MMRFRLSPGLSYARWAAAAFAAVLISCGGGSSGPDLAATPEVQSGLPASTATNVLSVLVDRGPAGGSFNMPFVNVTVCSPGTTTCQTVDHVVVDTGSHGLRLMASALDPALTLPAVGNAGNAPVAECAQFAGGFTWGSVRRADIRLAGEIAAGLPMQVIADPQAPYAAVPAACSNTGSNLGTVALLGAKGILGVSSQTQDCPACASSTAPGIYYACPADGCTSTLLPRESQVANPVPLFAVNNNGLSLTLPGVPPGGVSNLVGTLTFGIGTQPNNQLGEATVFATSSQGSFTTIYKDTSYPASFIDSGSNGLLFNDPGIPVCSSFYCPPQSLPLSAVNSSSNGAVGTVTFTVDNVRALSAGASAANLGGPSGLDRSFVWGLPFFFGRTVFVAIRGAPTPKGSGPYVAY